MIAQVVINPTTYAYNHDGPYAAYIHAKHEHSTPR
jgi:hypothetical protein